MAERKLRVGMIGAGGISRTHCDGWKKLPYCELVAITDVHQPAAAARAAEFAIESVEASGKRLLARKDIDIVDIVVPNRFHKPYTVAALDSGKHVLCEKPLALTVREVDAMIAASRKNKRLLMCAQHMRFQANSAALKEYITERPLGDIYYARAWYHRRRQLPTRPGFIFKEQSGGGCCVDIGVHILDLALYLMDNFEPVSVSGIAVTKLAKLPGTWSEWNWGCFDKQNLDVEDFASGFVRFANGAVLSLECSFLLNMKPRTESRIDLFGTASGAKWPECEIFDHTSSNYADTRIEVRDGGEKAHHAEIRAFAEAVSNKAPAPVAAEQTRAVIAILEGIYKSQQLGREVRLQLGNGRPGGRKAVKKAK